MKDLNNELLEHLIQRIELLEKQLKKHSKSKMADKDYDKDGKIETSEEEYLGSKDRAIKMAMQKKVNEALERVGGTATGINLNVESLANNAGDKTLVEAVSNILTGKNTMNKKAFKDEGTKIQLSEKFIFGGFPRVKLTEENATQEFQDGPNRMNVATKTNKQEETISWKNIAGFDVPSESFGTQYLGLRNIEKAFLDAAEQHRVYGKDRKKEFHQTEQGAKMLSDVKKAREELTKHPHYKEFSLGHPSKRLSPEKAEEIRRLGPTPESMGYGRPGSGSRWTGD